MNSSPILLYFSQILCFSNLALKFIATTVESFRLVGASRDDRCKMSFFLTDQMNGMWYTPEGLKSLRLFVSEIRRDFFEVCPWKYQIILSSVHSASAPLWYFMIRVSFDDVFGQIRFLFNLQNISLADEYLNPIETLSLCLCTELDYWRSLLVWVTFVFISGRCFSCLNWNSINYEFWIEFLARRPKHPKNA